MFAANQHISIQAWPVTVVTQNLVIQGTLKTRLHRITERQQGFTSSITGLAPTQDRTLWTCSGRARPLYVLSDGVQGMAGLVQLAAGSWA